MADVYDFIASYGRDSGIPNLQLNKEGFCSLNFDTVINVDIVFTQEHDQCTFASNIGDIPAVDQAGFFKELLKERLIPLVLALASTTKVTKLS